MITRHDENAGFWRRGIGVSRRWCSSRRGNIILPMAVIVSLAARLAESDRNRCGSSSLARGVAAILFSGITANNTHGLPLFNRR